MSEGGESPSSLGERYEELRSLARNGGETRGGLGLALFLRRGMAAWMEAWTRCQPSPGSDARPKPKAVPAESATVMAPGLHAEVALVLAGMALVGHEETRT